MSGDTHTPPVAHPERRHLTVMFCDMVDSTGHAQRLDPEELGEIIGRLLGACANEVERAGGTVARCFGDGLLAYFGFPEAHEDDARRCVSAALAILGAVRHLNEELQRGGAVCLAVRVGIHSGLALVGDLGPGSPRDPLTSIGEAPNLAARLQQQAPPGGIVVSATTYRVVRGYFDFQHLGPKMLKGFPEPVDLYAVTGESAVKGRMAVEARGGFTPMVGRCAEQALLRRRRAQAAAGKGRAVLLSGEAGIGKSRLLQAFKEELRGSDFELWEMFGSPQHPNSPWYPVVEMLRDRLDALGRARAAESCDSLSVLCPSGSSEDCLRTLEDLLFPHPDDGATTLALPPENRKYRRIQVLAELFRARSRARPLALLIEDLHWMDSSTLDLVGELLGFLAHERICLLATCRPEFRVPWPDKPALGHCVLSGLDAGEMRLMIRYLCAGRDLSDSLVEQVLSQSDGVPLFIEELARALLDGVNAALSPALAPDTPAASIPPTLRDLLAARLDRTGEARHLVQLAAILGRNFARDVLAVVAELPESELAQRLERLVDEGILQWDFEAPLPRLRFRHALIQQAASDSMLKRDRPALHLRAARAMVECFPELAQGGPALVAHHFIEARQPRDALRWLETAASQALAQSANLEAAAHLEQGLALIDELPQGAERDGWELKLRLALGVAQTATDGAAAASVADTYRRAVELGNAVGLPDQRFAALWGLWRGHQARAELASARDLSRRLTALAAHSENRLLVLEAHHAAWTTAWLTGEPENASTHVAAGLELYDSMRCEGHALVYGGHDAAVCARVLGALARWLTGEPGDARRLVEGAIAQARSLRHPASLVHALHWGMPTYQALGDAPSVVALAREIQALAEQPGLVSAQIRDRAQMMLGWGLEQMGSRQGLDLMERGLAARPREERHLRPYFHALLADLLLRRGKDHEARVLIAEALSILERTGERWWEPEVRRLAAAAHPDQAPHQLQLAVERARKQGARSLELRASSDLLRLARSRGAPGAEAEARLRALCRAFPEGLDSPDLAQARALLPRLQP